MDRLTWVLCRPSKLTWFWYAVRKSLGISVRIEIDWVMAWMVEIDLISMWGIDVYLILVQESESTFVCGGGRKSLVFSIWIEIKFVFCVEASKLT